MICSRRYLRRILKERYGLKGYVRADFGAVNRLKTSHHMTADSKESIRMAVDGGLDVQGFDFSNSFWEKSLVSLVEEGKLEESVMDEAVSRVLRVKFELGLFENPYTEETHYKDVVRCEKHRMLSLRAARESMVLLQNKGGLLPLRGVKSIALLGPSSGHQRIGSYSSVPYGYKVPSLYEELKKAAGDDIVIRQCDGCGISDRDISLVPESWYEDGVELTFYNNDHFEGEPAGTNRMEYINFNWILAKPHRDLEFTGYSVKMKCMLHVDTHVFTEADEIKGRLVFTTGDSVRVMVDGKCVIDSFGDHKQKLPGCEFLFVNGAVHEVEIEYVCDVNGNDLTLSMDFHDSSLEKAVALAEECDMTILVCGDDKVTSGEGMDRCDLKLYGKQKELVERVGALGKPSVLVLENGKPVDLRDETESMDAILVAWFGGELGAKAIAEALFGKINPSGRLPISFPKSVGHIPCYYSRLPGGSREYLEGNINALFPFGFGLSYTEFTYRDLVIEKREEKYSYRAAVKVRNAGERFGTEVVQLYINDLLSSVVRPDRLLKGFCRVDLEPGEEKEVEFLLDFDSFKLLNLDMEWVVEPGEFEIIIGSSSADTGLSRIITVEE